MATAGKGLPFIGKMGLFLDRVLHPTVQKVGHSKAALDVIARGFYLLNPVAAVPYVVGAGSTDNLINLTAHGFKAGDVVRLVTTANAISEHEITIDSIVDANSFTLAGYLSASLTTGDTFDCLRPVISRVSSDGSSLSTTIVPPIQYNRKSAGVTTATTVLEDLDTPANSRALPVVLHGVDAANITITSDQLNIATSHVNDSMSLGDGTTLVGVTASNELKTHDANLLTGITNVISTVNTTLDVPLAGGGTFTGTAEELTQYRAIDVSCAVDQSGTLIFDYSVNGINWGFTQTYPITVATPGTLEGFYFGGMVEARYFRIRYVNGATAQGVFRLQTILRKNAGTGEILHIDQPIIAKTDAMVTKGVIFGLTTGGGGGYVAVKVTPSGALTADVTSAQLPATLGQKVMTASTSVVIASDQSSIPTTTSGAFLSSAANSSTTPLAGGATFTGTAIDTSGYSSISVLVYSDVTSAVNGVLVEYSGDGINWDEATVGTFTPGASPNEGQMFGAGIRARYARVVYTNGATIQTTFRLFATLRALPMLGDLVDMETVLGLNTHGIVTKSVMTGKTTAGGGAFVDVKVNPSGALTADVTGSVTVSGTVTANIGTSGSLALEATQLAGNVLLGAVTETAPASDTASSGLNGRLQRIAQNISALILQLPATLGIKTAAASLSVAPASDAIFNVKDKALTGTYAENLTLTTVQTFTAPANAIGAIVQADDANAASFRAKQGAAATATSGMQLQAGRDMEFKSGSDISVCSEGASVKVYVQWFIQA